MKPKQYQKSKHYVSFLNNSAHLDTDLEFVDLIRNAFDRDKTGNEIIQNVFKFVDKEKHLKLNSRNKSHHSVKSIANHLQSTIREAYIKRLFEEMSLYFQRILKSAIDKGIDIDRIIGDNVDTLTVKEIIKLGNFEKVTERISDLIFRKLENAKNTKSLIEKMNIKLNLNINEEFINNALPYIELRHLIVHNSGKADKAFHEKFPTIGTELDKKIVLSSQIINDAKHNISNLIEEFDKNIIEKSIIKERDIAHRTKKNPNY